MKAPGVHTEWETGLILRDEMSLWGLRFWEVNGQNFVTFWQAFTNVTEEDI